MLRATAILFLSFVVFVLGSEAANAKAHIECLRYASQAERAQQINQRTCRRTGPRWEAAFMAHYNWCLTASRQLRQSETAARAQDIAACKIGVSRQALVNGDPVSTARQKELGLVTVFAKGGCSGTLINKFWILTADHCITSDGAEGGPTQPVDKIAVRASWNPNSFKAEKVVRYNDRGLDVALIMLGRDALALEGATKLLYPHEPFGLSDQEIPVMAYGRGLSQLAVEGPPAVPGVFDGAFRSGRFIPRLGSQTEYYFTPNASGQIIGGGDSGGPDHVLGPNGSHLGIVGVHSRCWFDYAAGKDDLSDGGADWQWAKDIDLCESDAIITIREDILREIKAEPFDPRSAMTREVGAGQISNLEIVSAGMSDNTDRPGSDYRRFEQDSRSPQICQRACEEEIQCRAWTYVRAGVQGPKPVCYLKNAAPAARSNACCISGVPVSRDARVVQPSGGFIAGTDNTDRPGNDYARFEFDGEDSGVCQRACAEDTRCKAWTHVRPGFQGPRSVCYLKNPAPPARQNNCCVSGTKP